MILYDSNNLRYIWRLEGSTAPKALIFTVPSVVLTILVKLALRHYNEHFGFLEEISGSFGWTVLTLVLSLLLAVRTNSAYARFWEGITLAQQMRAEWFETASSLMAFSMVAAKKDDNMAGKVNQFQFILIRLMSLMHGAALRQIGGNDEEFEVLDVHGLDSESLEYLIECGDSDVNRVEVLLHWIQVLITDSHTSGVIGVPSPILTRAYQTLSRGMVHLHNARKLADVPFPFPLSQMMGMLLIVQSFLTPVYVASLVEHVVPATLLCFVPVFGMWSVAFTAGELDHPFGTDPNDLPLSVIQYEFNAALLMLLDRELQRAPWLNRKSKQNVQLLRFAVGQRDSVSMTNFVLDPTSRSDEDNKSRTTSTFEVSGMAQSVMTTGFMMGRMATTSSRHSGARTHHEQLQKRREKMKRVGHAALLNHTQATSTSTLTSERTSFHHTQSLGEDVTETCQQGQLGHLSPTSAMGQLGQSLGRIKELPDNLSREITASNKTRSMHEDPSEAADGRPLNIGEPSLDNVVRVAIQALQAVIDTLPYVAGKAPRYEPSTPKHGLPLGTIVPRSPHIVPQTRPKEPRELSPMTTPRDYDPHPDV